MGSRKLHLLSTVAVYSALFLVGWDALAAKSNFKINAANVVVYVDPANNTFLDQGGLLGTVGAAYRLGDFELHLIDQPNSIVNAGWIDASRGLAEFSVAYNVGYSIWSLDSGGKMGIGSDNLYFHESGFFDAATGIMKMNGYSSHFVHVSGPGLLVAMGESRPWLSPHKLDGSTLTILPSGNYEVDFQLAQGAISATLVGYFSVSMVPEVDGLILFLVSLGIIFLNKFRQRHLDRLST